VNVSSGPKDWSRKNPWRAPGSAPVIGSGCGSAGGGPTALPCAGGVAPPGFSQGDDALKVLPAHGDVTIWERGSVVEVAWAITANHGGGYAYRLCKSNGNISEECFQRNHLRFSGNLQWLQFGDNVSSRLEVPLVRVTQGTHPKGSEWARNPIPACRVCDTSSCGNLTSAKGMRCAQHCAGYDLPGAMSGTSAACPAGTPTEFPELSPGVSGYTRLPLVGLPYNIVDLVEIPGDIGLGDYLLSWRWDAEQTAQVWQNCADIKIVEGSKDLIV